MVPAGQQFYLHLYFRCVLEMTWQLVFEKHSRIECFHTFDWFDIQSSFLSFFSSFEKNKASLSWREAAIDFYLEAEVKGSLARSPRLNVYWPVICHMVCIFKCARMSWDHLRAASFSGWAEIESRPVFVLRGLGAFLMLAARLCTFQMFCAAYWISLVFSLLSEQIQHTDQHPFQMLSFFLFKVLMNNYSCELR